MAEDRSLKTKVVKGLAWKILELAGAQGVQFLVAIIIARLMTPQEYGTIGLITIFITIANVFVQSGFATALIRKATVDDADYSSVFWMSMIMSVVVYGLLYLAAPLVATYYDTPILMQLMRVTAIILFPGAVVSIQTAYVSRHIDFKRLFVSTMVAVVVSGVVAIFMAYRGWGVWAISVQQIVYYFVLMLALFVEVEWRPKAELAVDRLKGLFSFGWKILLSGLIDTIWMNIYGLIIGKRYSQADLGGYNRGEQFPKILSSNLAAAIQAVMLPAYSKVQDDKTALKSMMKKTIKMSSLVICPMMIGLMAIADPMVRLILTDKWLICVPYLRIMCLIYILWPIHVTNLQMLNAIGRSDLYLKLEIIKKVIGISMLIYSFRYGIMGMLAIKLLSEFICTFVNAHPCKKLIDYGIGEQYRDIAPSFIAAAIMGAVAYLIPVGTLGLGIELLLRIVAGVVMYLIVINIINKESVEDIIKALHLS